MASLEGSMKNLTIRETMLINTQFRRANIYSNASLGIVRA